jgi:hypothetical protein
VDVIAGIGIVLAVGGLVATMAVALLQMGQATRELNVINVSLVESLALMLGRFDRLGEATADIRRRLP